jgi:hypothetical protein
MKKLREAKLLLSSIGGQVQKTWHTGISPEQRPTVVHRVIEKKEPLRKVADDYSVPFETIRRMVRAVRKLQAEKGVFTGNIIHREELT